MTADLSRMSPAARARARGCRPDVPCPEAEEFRDGLESYHEGEVWPADSWAELPLSFRRGYEAGQGGRQLPRAAVWEPSPSKAPSRGHVGRQTRRAEA